MIRMIHKNWRKNDRPLMQNRKRKGRNKEYWKRRPVTGDGWRKVELRKCSQLLKNIKTDPTRQCRQVNLNGNRVKVHDLPPKNICLQIKGREDRPRMTRNIQKLPSNRLDRKLQIFLILPIPPRKIGRINYLTPISGIFKNTGSQRVILGPPHKK